MKTKTIFKMLAAAMLMPTMLLTTACSNSDDEIINTENPANTKGYALPVTINVTRQGDDATTRATYTYDEDTKKGTLAFSTGDKLFVYGCYDEDYLYDFAGELTWQSGDTFSGTLYLEGPFEGTAEELLNSALSASANLLPAGYDSYGFWGIDKEGTCDAWLRNDPTKAFALTKATAVEQFSEEFAEEYNDGFTLSPTRAIVSFTISGLEANKEITVSIGKDTYELVGGSVTTDALGDAIFAIGVMPCPLNVYSLTVDGNVIALPDKTVGAGKIYNISRSVAPAGPTYPDGAISGVFSVSATKKVYFSKGNLRYASGTWSFFDNQYDYYTSYSADAWDKFCWSTSATTYGMNTATKISTYSGNFVDWGATMGAGWFTLSSAEWTYLFNTRTVNGGTGSGKSYTLGQSVNGKLGVVIYPDNYTGEVYSGSDWATFESAGCVFLPAAGYRFGTSVGNAGTYGGYWSATPNGTSYANYVYFKSGSLSPADKYSRYYGCSIRLVRQVE